MIRTLVPWLMVALCTITSAAEGAQTVVLQRHGAASLSTTAGGRDGQVELALSGTLPLTILLTGVTEVKLDSLLANAEAWQVQPERPIQDRDAGTWQQRFVLLPLVPGKQSLLLEPIEFRDRDGSWQTVAWKPIAVEITTEIGKADLSELRDITDIERLPPEPSLWDEVKWGVAVVGGLVVLGTMVWLWRRRRRPVTVLSPEEWALRELDRLDKLSLPASGDSGRFHTLVSNIVRRYLERRLQLPARRQTTPEFLAALEQSPQLAGDEQRLLREFLERCDLAKFAGSRQMPAECTATAALGRRLIALTAERKIDVDGRVSASSNDATPSTN